LEIHDPEGIVSVLVKKAETVLRNNNLLRVYWYDGVRGALSSEHKKITDIDDVQLRAGTINGNGQQKGVDSLIVTDLVELAANHAIEDALVVTGDSDLAVGILIAQKRGVRVAVPGLEEKSLGVLYKQSFELTRSCELAKQS
jgi:uncharacterized LabA/DUF88 family protein